MAFNQNLRPLNIAQSMSEESRITPVYYPSSASDTGFVGIGYGNAMPGGVTGWMPVMPTAVIGPVGVNSPTTGYCYSPDSGSGSRAGDNASDKVSDEGGDDLASGKKVKFLCSFGGKILPRPSDGVLRYAGGQTRIISVRRDVSFSELVQKMVETFGQNVVIKYQLPEEELDALVSVSCSDDLEHMMDEYKKLAERSSDGSAKLRLFLFSASEFDSLRVEQLGDLEDSGQKYMEAVNGIADGIGGGIMRKESSASAASTQNSDISGSEAVDSTGHSQGDATGPPSGGGLSPKEILSTSQETSPKVVLLEPKPAIFVEASGAPLSIPVIRPGATPTLSARPVQEFERSVPVTVQQQQQMGFDVQQPGVNFPPPTSYLQAYVDPQQTTLNRADYVQVPSQTGFPGQLVGSVGPMFTQQQFRDNAIGVSSHHQFIPAMHMTMTPSSHVSIKSNTVSTLVQPQQIQLERYPEESTYRQRLVQLPSDHSYNAYQAQVSPVVVGGGFGGHQAPQPEQKAFSEGWISHQQVIFPEKIPRFEECYMCQKALPHAHSDPIAQDKKESPATTLSDLNSVYQSLQLVDNIRGRPINRAAVTGTLGDGTVEKQGAGSRSRILGYEAEKPLLEGVGLSRNVEGLYETDRTIIQKAENPDHPMVVPQGVVVQSPYGVFMGTTPQLCQENAVKKLAVPTQYQVKKEDLMNRPVYSDTPLVGGLPPQTLDHIVHESPKDNSGELPGINPHTLESCFSYDHLRQIDERIENRQIHPTEVLLNNEQSMLPVDTPRKEDILENRPQQIAGREPYLDNTFSNPKTVIVANQIKQNEMLPCSSNEVPSNFRRVESYVAVQQPFLGIPGYPQSKHAVNHLIHDEISYGNPAFSGVDSAPLTERVPPISEWKDNPSRFQPKMVPWDVEDVLSDGIFPPSPSPSNRVGDILDNSNSLFSQDPWTLQHDTHIPPPRTNKTLTIEETFGTRDPFGDNRFGNIGESPTRNSGCSTTELHLEDGVYQTYGNSDLDFGPEQVRSSQGSGEELIKHELQAVAEGVDASVFQLTMPLNPDLTISGRSGYSSEANQNNEFKNTDVEMQHGDRFEDINTKLLEKTNLGSPVSPVSDGIGRLQIIKNSDLEELRELGSGTFGTVYHGKWRGSDVAIKRINDRCFAGKPSEQERMRDDFWNEAIKLADLHHPNVVAFYGVVLDGPGDTVATVTEYMVNGSLRNALQKNERNLDKRKRLIIAMDVAFGMEYLHGKNIVHFDLKSDNLLVNLRDPHRPICKVGDLGLSKVKCQTLISGGVRGTLPWMAPELLNGSSSLVSEKVDVFSFGIVLWELLTGDEPYADLHYGAIIGGIVSNTLRPAVPEYCDPELGSLMERCWSSETLERPSFTEIANQLRNMATKARSPKSANPPTTTFINTTPS